VLNFIPYNDVEGAGLGWGGLPAGFRRPPPARAEALVARLHARGVLAKLRRSAGQDVDAGCGQLRARAVNAAARQGLGV
jgi:23S rRNA (adenine2503-C2)-methyltransferase